MICGEYKHNIQYEYKCTYGLIDKQFEFQVMMNNLSLFRIDAYIYIYNSFVFICNMLTKDIFIYAFIKLFD